MPSASEEPIPHVETPMPASPKEATPRSYVDYGALLYQMLQVAPEAALSATPPGQRWAGKPAEVSCQSSHHSSDATIPDPACQHPRRMPVLTPSSGSLRVPGPPASC